MSNVLVIANGAREHAIAAALKRTPNTNVYCFANAVNPGIKKLCKAYEVGDLKDFEAILNFAQKHTIDFVVPGPEAVICAGITDYLNEHGNIKSLAPTKANAQLEGSKGFTRNLMQKYGIAGLPKYKVFNKQSTPVEITQFINEDLNGQYVVKYDGLIGGKGVKVGGEHLQTISEGVNYALECLETSEQVVIEEKFVGQEFSLIALSDGQNLYHFPVVQDHKRAFDGDTGPNTGGMGTYTDANHTLPFLTKEDLEAAKAINQEVIRAVKTETGQPFVGFLYGGFMVTAKGVGLIEYNTRLGDPEAENILTLFTDNFTQLCEAALTNKLAEISFQPLNEATVCLYAVPDGYPDTPIKDVPITVPKAISKQLYFASVDLIEETEDSYVLNLLGSRAVACVGRAENLEAARLQAVELVSQIQGPVRFRTDIAGVEIIAGKIDQMRKLRS